MYGSARMFRRSPDTTCELNDIELSIHHVTNLVMEGPSERGVIRIAVGAVRSRPARRKLAAAQLNSQRAKLTSWRNMIEAS